MIRLVLSVTARLVLSVTTGSSYQEPKQGLSLWDGCKIQPLNYANIESFRFLLTQIRLWTSGAARGAAENENPEFGIMSLNGARGQ